MIPGVPPPGGMMPRPIDAKLKKAWRFDTKRRVFSSTSGETFEPAPTLPAGSRIAYKVPKLAEADPASLSEPEQDLARYLHVILPKSESPHDWLEAVRAWPATEDATIAPDVGLPLGG